LFSRRCLALIVTAVCWTAVAVSGCTSSDSLDPGDASAPATGAAGSNGSGTAGTQGAAGTKGATTGGAGTVAASGAAGTTTSGGAGTGAAGTSGAAGTKVDAGAPDKNTGAAGASATVDPTLTYTTYVGPILTNNGCGGCHYIQANGVPPYQGGFGLSYENFMAAVTPAHAGCPNLDASKRRVVPGDPDHSLIYIKISVANLPGSCGGHMPYMGLSLSADYQMKVRQWILNGAPK
jgi:hypothetical protein